MIIPTKDDFRKAVAGAVGDATQAGQTHIDVNSGDLHRLLGGYPGKQHAMPSCCDAMYEEHARGRADILAHPPKGKGASLTIRYHLPR